MNERCRDRERKRKPTIGATVDVADEVGTNNDEVAVLKAWTGSIMLGNVCDDGECPRWMLKWNVEGLVKKLGSEEWDEEDKEEEEEIC